MIPVAWGDVRGWYEPPAPDTAVKEAMLFVGALGTEDLCARHSMGQLARELARNGHPVLRMDLPGTGDALGDLLDANRWESWLQAVLSGLERLREWTGQTSIGLLGLRVGGSVALTAAARLEAGQLGSLILLAPVMQGKQFVRELRTLAAPGEALVVDGIQWGESLQASLRAADASAYAAPPASRVLLAIHHSGRATTQWIETCQGAGLPVSCLPYGDLAAHIGDTIAGRPPSELWQAIPRWMADAPVCRSSLSAPVASATLFAARFSEEGVQVPSVVPLAGVICLPIQRLTPNAPLVVLCNTGRNPHTGWARSWVQLARALAAHGIGSLRLDMAGTGDSPDSVFEQEELLYNDRAVLQIRHAIDWLSATFGNERPLALAGLCTGGYLAFHTATQDTRVTHLLLLNVQKFIWVPGTSLQIVLRGSAKSAQAYRKLMFQPSTWLRLLKGDIDLRTVSRRFVELGKQWLDRWMHHSAHPQPVCVAQDGQNGGAMPTAVRTIGSIRHDFTALARRGTRTTVLYSEDDGGRDEFARYFGQSARTFRKLPGTRLSILADADHMLTRPSDQEAVLNELLNLFSK